MRTTTIRRLAARTCLAGLALALAVLLAACGDGSKPEPTATATAAPSPNATRTARPPRATATPAPPKPTPTPRQPIQKVTKLGVGVYVPGGGHIVDILYRCEPTVILLQDPEVEFAKEVRYWFPKAFIVGRRNFGQQPLDNPEQRGEQAADYVAQLAVPLKGVVDAWMSYNEVGNGQDVEAMKAYNAFQVAFARRLQNAHGVDAVAGNDAVAALTPEQYVSYFAGAISESRYFGVHAYAPKEAKSLQDQAEWYVLRYRKIHEALTAAGIQHGRFILTETGLWAGWRGVVDEAEMVREWFWLSDEMDKDDYVIGQAIFGVFGDGQWPAFDIANTGIVDALGRYKR